MSDEGVVELGRFRLPVSLQAALRLLEAFTVDRPDATVRQRGAVLIVEAPVSPLPFGE
jgi:hypothetical protein